MAITEVKGIKKFKKGMCLKSTYMWTGEPTKTYYYKVTKPQYGGKGADVKIYRTDTDGKKDKYPRARAETFIWDFETQIGRVKPRDGKGWGRTVPTKC